MTLQLARIGKIALIVGLLLLIPLAAMQFSTEVTWTGSDFVFAGILLFGAGMAYELISRRSANFVYKAGTAVGVGTGLILIWGSLAVGEYPYALMFLGVVATAFLGSLLVWFKPKGLVYVMYLAAAGHAVIVMVAQVLGFRDFDIFMVNAFFAILWVGAGLLFRKAAEYKSV